MQTRDSPALLEREGHAVEYAELRAQRAHRAEQAELGHREVGRVVLAGAQRRAAGRVLAEHVAHVEPPHEQGAHVADRGGEPVAVLERPGAGHGRSLLAEAPVEAADDMPLFEQGFEALLHAAGQQHEPVDVPQVGRSEVAQRGILAGGSSPHGNSVRMPNICAAMLGGQTLYLITKRLSAGGRRPRRASLHACDRS